MQVRPVRSVFAVCPFVRAATGTHPCPRGALGVVVRWKMPVLAWSSWALASLCLVLAANSIDDRPNVATSLISLALYLTAAASFALPTRVSLRASDGVLTVRNPFRRHEVEVRSIREVHLGSATTPMTLARGWPVLVLELDDGRVVRVSSSIGRQQASVDRLVVVILDGSPEAFVDPKISDAFY